MPELANGIEQDYRAEWVEAGRPTPLRVERSAYDETTVSWEVMWHDSLWDGKSGCASPIAEFTTWQEAQDWAQNQALLSTVFRIGRDSIVGPMPRPWDWRDAA
ncbi:hypothetical protein [Leifsonia sp. P73]|uniref:hypothetical protein n=1 Tax=Leifsonia sp. P73 TaxID=3423959 RepID=UPI003DA2D5D9